MPSGILTLIIVTGSMFALFIIISTVGNYYSLNRIKNKTVGQGQHGTARWATKKEVKKTYKRIDFQPNEWRRLLPWERVGFRKSMTDILYS